MLTRRYFLRTLALGASLSTVPPRWLHAALVKILPLPTATPLRLVLHGPEGQFSILYKDEPLLGRAWCELFVDNQMLSSRDGSLQVTLDTNDSALRFQTPDGSLQVLVATFPAPEGVGMVLPWKLINHGSRPVRLKKMTLAARPGADGGGIRFWKKKDDVRVLTDEWERCYGEARMAPLNGAGTVRSAWDVHIFDRQEGRTLSCSYYDVPAGMLAFTIDEPAGNDEAGFSASMSTMAGADGVLVSPGAIFRAGETLLRVHEGSPVDALVSYAQVIAKRNNVHLNGPVPTGWVDWYFAKGNVSGEDIVQNIELIARELRAFGLQYIQIDSGWQLGIEASPPPHNVVAGGPWVPNSKFSRGMKWFADRIRERGFAPGLWIRPLQEIDAAPDRAAHPAWFNAKGQMDASNPGVRQHVLDLCRSVTDRWGFEYVKYDFVAYDLFNEWGPRLFDHHAAITDPLNKRVTGLEAYREVMADIRTSTEGKARVLSCNGLMPHTLGVADAFRIGDDVGDWQRTFRNGVKSIAARFYTHGILWWNDPDCLLVREPFTMDQAQSWASLIGQTGNIVFVSEDLRVLPANRLAIIKKVLPVYQPNLPAYAYARPADFLENSPPELWVLNVRKPFGSWLVVGIYNWSDSPKKKTVTRKEIGVTAPGECSVYDFWKEEYLGDLSPELQFEMAPWSCRILGIHRHESHPHIIGTTRHITQGGIELDDVRWNEAEQSLNGAAAMISGHPYAVILRVPPGYEVVSARGVTISVRQKATGTCLFTVPGESSGSREWQVLFRKTAR